MPIPVDEHAARGDTDMATILVVDDEPAICMIMQEFLESRGYRVKTALSGPTALTTIQDDPPDVILLDLLMPGMNGLQVLCRLYEMGLADRVIIQTGSRNEPLLLTTMLLDVFEILLKPADLDEIEFAVMLKLALGTDDSHCRPEGP